MAVDSQLGWSGRGLFALLLFSMLASFPYFERVRNANERPRLMQGMAMVDGGTFRIGGKAGHGMDPGPDISTDPDTGALYPNKAPGASFVAAMAYVGGRSVDRALKRPFTLRDYTWWARLFGGILPTILIAGWAWRRYRTQIGAAGLSVALVTYVLCTPAFSYAHLFYGHQLAALLMFVGVGFVADGYRLETANLSAWGGLICACAVAVEYGAVFAALPIGITLVAGAARRGDRGLASLAAGIAGALIPIALLAWYQDSAFGSPWSTGYHNASNPVFAAKHAQGFLGLGVPTVGGFHRTLTALGSGLFAWSPVVVPGLYGLAQLSLGDNQRRVEARLHLGIFVTMVVVGAGLVFDGGWRIGPRYLVFTLPGLILGWGHVFNQVRTHPLRCGFAFVVVFYSMGLNLMAGNLWPHMDLSAVHGPFGEVLVPLFAERTHPYDIGDLLGLEWGAWLVFGVPLLGTVVVFWHAIETGIRMFYVLAATPFVVSMLWLGTAQMGDHPRAEANLAYIRGVYEPVGEDREPGASFVLLAEGERP